MFSFKKLLMPGAVIERHAEFETECGKCHTTGGESSQRILCLGCHEEIAEDEHAATGFHGRFTDESKNGECSICHSEHIGRQGDIVHLNIDAFDHSRTDFDLGGKHAKVNCTSCHLPEKYYREAPSSCYACHSKNDRHQGAFGKECQDCHSTEGWGETQFDHNETRFQLIGGHKETQCNTCHPDEKYTETPTSCFSCHVLNDVHGGSNGEKCDSCHSETQWGTVRFDHNTDTDFKLRGSHSELVCSACHETSDFEIERDISCIGCHKDDEHHGRNGRDCANCHAETTWGKVIFDHNSDTKFKLKGKHASLPCGSCHADSTHDVQLGSACADCHNVDDVHNGTQEQKCNDCHNEKGWSAELRFNHDLTVFPLVGVHAVTSCNSCHVSQEFRATDRDCVACHAIDDDHELALGGDCGGCHNPNGWQLWIFNHDKQTEFPLEGKHAGLRCIECHSEPTENQVKKNSSCATCHKHDDVHRRRFGRSCERCHGTDSFEEIRMQ